MPSCAEFGIINQYLSIKDQFDSGFFPDETELDLLEKQKQQQYVDEIFWQEAPKPANFLDTDTPSWLLEPVTGRLCDLTGSAITTTTTTPTSNNTTAMTSPSLHSGGPTPVSHKTIISGMSGGTVMERRAMAHPTYESDDISCGSSDDSSHDLYDLDAQTVPFAGGDDSSTTSSSHSHSSSPASALTTVKLEHQDGGYGYGGYGGSPQWSFDTSPSPVQMPTQYEDGMQSMINSIRDEIRETANSLCISTNPYKWSHADTQRWVHHICLRNDFPTSCVPHFNLQGRELCQLDLKAFVDKTASQDAGNFLHQSLDIMKMARQIHPDTPVEERSAFFSNYLGGEKPVLPPRSADPYHTTSPAPSTASHCSTSSEEDVYMSASCQPSQAVAHNAPSHVVPTPPRAARPGKQTIHLWQFLRELLDDPDSYQSCIKWLDRSKGIFKIEDSSKVAKFWGKRKNRPAMNYDKLSRSVRQYYKKGIIRKTEMSKRLVYQFCTPYL